MSKKKRKKKARITNRQAKIRQKKTKPSKQAITKYKRLQQKVKDGFEKHFDEIQLPEPENVCRINSNLNRLEK